MNYTEFLQNKAVAAPMSGFVVRDDEIHPALLPHQRIAVAWAVAGGRRALFESFGLGKSIQQLEYCRLVLKHEGGKALIITPLGVRQEFIRDAVELLGMEAPRYITCRQEALDAPEGAVLLTNYERVREGDIEPLDFTACCLDEASVLRSFGSKTYQSFLDKFKGVRFKLVATATPDPNRYKELIHYAGFLEVMDTGQALTRFFQRDSTKANNLTLYPHKEEEFWLWVSTWSFFLSSPADLGLDATGYDLPPLDVRYHKMETPRAVTVRKDGQMQLFEDAAEGLAQAAKEKRESIALRVARMKEIVDSDPQAHSCSGTIWRRSATPSSARSPRPPRYSAHSHWTSASAREGTMIPPTQAEVYLYMSELDVEFAPAESEKFVAWNALRGWDCLPNWKAAADLWCARIGERG